ncbi:LysR substrate binding domain protein [compost metagenome]
MHYLDEIGRPKQISLRSTSILAQQNAAIAGAGIAILPSFSARKVEGLVEVLADQVEFVRTFWMLMPVEGKDLARMRVTWDFLREMAQSNQDVMMGR